LNREELGKIVFNCSDCLQDLNRITHPHIMRYYKDALHQLSLEKPEAIVILEVPLLYETNMEKICRQVVVVWVDRETQVKRLMERENLSHAEAIKRIDSQMPLDEKARRADFVIDNRGGMVETKENAAIYYKEILQAV
jgi:dephospho-CoA kinase